MEEKKLKKAKTTETKEEVNADKQQKLSYDQLNDICMQLHQQNQALTRQVQQLNLSNMFKRLDYLFLVLKNADVIADYDFVDKCVSEIKDALTPPEEKEEQTDLKTN